MHWILCSAAAAGLVLGGSTATFAQSAGIKAYDAMPRYSRTVRPAPRIKRYHYYYYYPGTAWRSGCGVYHYWSDGRCVDARLVPPELK